MRPCVESDACESEIAPVGEEGGREIGVEGER